MAATLRPFLPARDHAESRRFYEALRFEVRPLGEALALVRLGDAAFLLQDFYVKDFAENLMLQLLVDDLDAWWAGVEALDLAATFGVQAPRAPQEQPWGQRVAYLWDPAGVLWHVAAAA